MRNPLPTMTDGARRKLLIGVAAGSFVLAVLAFGWVGLQMTGSNAPLVGGPTSTQYASGLTRLELFRVDPGGVYDRVYQPSWQNSPYNYSVTNLLDDGTVGPFERRSFSMRIEKIDVNAPVKSYGMNADLVPDVPLNGREVAWYTFSSPPGMGGNAVFAAHYTWAGGAVFNKLKDLQAGDTVYLSDSRGTELTYVVSESFIIDPADKNSLSIYGQTPEDTITLITCDGRYRSTGDPLLGGSYNNRRVVRAKLTNIYAPIGTAWNPG